MHQVSGWAVVCPAYDFRLSFTRSTQAIRNVSEEVSMAIIDATEKPAAALSAFDLMADDERADSTVVYTEVMHEGLELAVRSRGSLLLLGPMDDATWLELLGKKSQLHEPRRAA